MRAIGGELELKSNDYEIFFTDSGRSSLRLFLRSYNNKNKKYLLPNFFCEVIENVFIEENIDYKFYNVFEDLTIDVDSINKDSFDVLYIINYFGRYADVSKLNIENKILMEDNVFLDNFENHSNAKYWYGFNSFRKITTLSDGSLIKTNMKIEEDKILTKKTEFSTIKYEAKNIKYSYIHNNYFSENNYLDKFEEGEKLLDIQKNIYFISNESIFLLATQKQDQKIRKSRFDTLNSTFRRYAIMNEVSHYSFFVMCINDRDGFKRKLMDANIFLAVHWPKSTQNNNLYEFIISIPLFEIYNDNEFNILIQKIKEVL